jgi:hypothetical protein
VLSQIEAYFWRRNSSTCFSRSEPSPVPTGCKRFALLSCSSLSGSVPMNTLQCSGTRDNTTYSQFGGFLFTCAIVVEHDVLHCLPLYFVASQRAHWRTFEERRRKTPKLCPCRREWNYTVWQIKIKLPLLL